MVNRIESSQFIANTTSIEISNREEIFLQKIENYGFFGQLAVWDKNTENYINFAPQDVKDKRDFIISSRDLSVFKDVFNNLKDGQRFGFRFASYGTNRIFIEVSRAMDNDAGKEIYFAAGIVGKNSDRSLFNDFFGEKFNGESINELVGERECDKKIKTFETKEDIIGCLNKFCEFIDNLVLKNKIPSERALQIKNAIEGLTKVGLLKDVDVLVTEVRLKYDPKTGKLHAKDQVTLEEVDVLSLAKTPEEKQQTRELIEKIKSVHNCASETGKVAPFFYAPQSAGGMSTISSGRRAFNQIKVDKDGNVENEILYAPAGTTDADLRRILLKVGFPGKVLPAIDFTYAEVGKPLSVLQIAKAIVDVLGVSSTVYGKNLLFQATKAMSGLQKIHIIEMPYFQPYLLLGKSDLLRRSYLKPLISENMSTKLSVSQKITRALVVSTEKKPLRKDHVSIVPPTVIKKDEHELQSIDTAKLILDLPEKLYYPVEFQQFGNKPKPGGDGEAFSSEMQVFVLRKSEKQKMQRIQRKKMITDTSRRIERRAKIGTLEIKSHQTDSSHEMLEKKDTYMSKSKFRNKIDVGAVSTIMISPVMNVRKNDQQESNSSQNFISQVVDKRRKSKVHKTEKKHDIAFQIINTGDPKTQRSDLSVLNFLNEPMRQDSGRTDRIIERKTDSPLFFIDQNFSIGNRVEINDLHYREIWEIFLKLYRGFLDGDRLVNNLDGHYKRVVSMQEIQSSSHFFPRQLIFEYARVFAIFLICILKLSGNT